ncbi:MAG TPA: hypothetical protein VKB78_01535, partial [Pirellulales bacterium]|nr:hypothetical protein [Pirellulales bacterium]
MQADQLLRERSCPIDVIADPTKVHPHVAAIGPTQIRKRFDDSLAEFELALQLNPSFRRGAVLLRSL